MSDAASDMPARDTRRGEPWLRFLLALITAMAGVGHFVNAAGFVRIMPKLLPRAWDYPLVYFTGVCELAATAGLLIPPLRLRRITGWALVAFFIAVFPANIQAALDPSRMDAPAWATLARLPFQILLIAWAYRYTRSLTGAERT